MAGLRQIEIQLPDEFGLNKKVKVRSIHIYIEEGNQKVDVSYYFIWNYEGNEVKREIHSFTLDNNGEFQYLDYWDAATGDVIQAGIIEWFNNRYNVITE